MIGSSPDLPDVLGAVTALDPEKGILRAGQWMPRSKGTFLVNDLATGKPTAEDADGAAEDARLALDAASEAFPDWSTTAPRARSEALSRIRELMLRDRDSLASIIAAENGKSTSDARAEVEYVAEFFSWYAEEAARPRGDFGTAPEGRIRSVVTHRPVEVAALVTPWNFPLAMATHKVAPALADGCTAVLKPAAETSLSALAPGRLAEEAKVPAGVLNIVPGQDAASIVSAWMTDARIRKISFTGFKSRNGGQACTAANCFFVHTDVAAEFTAQLGARVETLGVGPAAAGNAIGPLISERAVEVVRILVERAIAAGATVAHQARVNAEDGYFRPPMVVTGAELGSVLARAEIFGPVAPHRHLDRPRSADRFTERGRVRLGLLCPRRRGRCATSHRRAAGDRNGRRPGDRFGPAGTLRLHEAVRH